MSKSFVANSRRLCLSASVLAIMAASPALATTTTLTSGQTYNSETATDTAVVVPTGVTAYYFNTSDSFWSPPAGSTIINFSHTSSSESSAVFNWWWGESRVNAPVLTVDSGGTLVVLGRTTETGSYDTTDSSTGVVTHHYYPGATAFQSMFNATGTVVFESNPGNELEIIGNNKFLGDVILRDGATVQIGWNWQTISFATTFGPNTHFDLQGASHLTLNPGDAGMFSGTMASSSAAVFELKSGTMVANGQSTAFKGTVQLDGGTSLMIGDSSHTSAAFGDSAGKTAQFNVDGTLSGYGTINGNVHNNGIIRAGGTSGVNGGLTINGNLTLTNNSILKTAMTPTGVNGLTVNGNMVAAGEMDIDIASGDYGNGVYSILVVNGGTITGSGFSRVVTTGSTGDVIAGLLGTSSGYSIVTEKGSSAQVYGHVLYANRLALTNFVGSLYDAMAMTPSSGAKVDTWATVNGGTVNLGRGGLGFDEKTYGLSVGGMHRFEHHGGVIGAAFSYRRGNMTVKDSATASTNGYDFGIYGGAEVNQMRFDGTVFYSINTADTNRPMGSYGTSKSSGKGYSYGVSGGISRDVFHGLMAPYMRGMYARVHLAAAAETGSIQYDLKHDGMNANTFVTDLGLRVHLLRPNEDQRIKLDANVAWRYDLSDPGETASVSFANFSSGSNTFFWKGDSKHALVVGLDGTGRVADRLEVFGRLNGILTSYRRAGELSVGVKYRF